MSPPKKHNKEQLEYRCKRCFAPATTQSSSAAESGQIANVPVKSDITKELDRIKQMEMLFEHFKATVDMDDKEALKTFLKLMEGPRDVEPTEFRRMG